MRWWKWLLITQHQFKHIFSYKLQPNTKLRPVTTPTKHDTNQIPSTNQTLTFIPHVDLSTFQDLSPHQPDSFHLLWPREPDPARLHYIYDSSLFDLDWCSVICHSISFRTKGWFIPLTDADDPLSQDGQPRTSPTAGTSGKVENFIHFKLLSNCWRKNKVICHLLNYSCLKLIILSFGQSCFSNLRIIHVVMLYTCIKNVFPTCFYYAIV